MAHDTVMEVFVILAALAFLAQAVLMYFIYAALKSLYSEITRIHGDVKQSLEPLVDSITRVVNEARGPLQSITADLREVSRLLRSSTARLDDLVADLADKSRAQMARADQLFSALANRVEDTADLLQNKILAPVLEVAALFKGIRSGFEFFFSRRPRAAPRREATHDQELFI
jgi:methyl-accepting chemotaxis protein